MNDSNKLLVIDAVCEQPLISCESYLDPPSTVQQDSTQAEKKRFNIVKVCYANNASSTSIHLSDDFEVNIFESLWASESINITITGNGWYLLSFRMAGRTQEYIGGQSYSVNPYKCSLTLCNDRSDYMFEYDAGEPFTEVCVAFKRSVLSQRLHIPTQDIDSLLQADGSDDGNPYFHQCAMTPQIEAVVCQLLDGCFQGVGGRIFAEAKVLELISLYLGAQKTEPERGRHVSEKDLFHLYKAKKHLVENFKKPKNIEDLARFAGINRRKLTEGFKAVFGMTVYQYTQFQRIEQAKKLLQGRVTSIGSLAEQVGYGYRSNFARVFQQYVGESPTVYAKRWQKITAP